MEFQSVDQVLDYAISKEEEAAVLYTELAERSERPGMRDAFLEFAHEEEGHIRHLESIRAGELPALTVRQVKGLGIAEHVSAQQPSPDTTYPEALAFAIKAEQAANELYSALAEATDDPNVSTIFTILADEEAEHKRRVELEYDEVVLEGN